MLLTAGSTALKAPISVQELATGTVEKRKKLVKQQRDMDIPQRLMFLYYIAFFFTPPSLATQQVNKRDAFTYC